MGKKTSTFTESNYFKKITLRLKNLKV